MDNELITKEHECVSHFLHSLDKMLDGIEQMTSNHRPLLAGERYLTDKEVAYNLKISRRTLQDYRNEGRIPYIQLGGKILYRESDVEKMLQDGYKPVFRKK